MREKTLLAIGEKSIIERLKKVETIEIIGQNIIYADGIFEMLEKESNIKNIIFSNKNFNVKEIIQMIIRIKEIYPKVECRIWLEKKEIIQKKEIVENIKIEKNIEDLIKSLNKQRELEVIAFYGNEQSGKTIFIYLFTLILKNRKILIINLDSKQKTIAIIFNKTQHVSILNIKLVNSKQIEEVMAKAKNNYDLILIDIFSGINKKVINEISLKTKHTLFFMGSNLCEIEKAKQRLKEKEGIKIILNKTNQYSISKQIIEKIVYPNRVLAEIEDEKQFEKVMNQGKINKEIKNKINNKIIKELNIWN